MPSGLLARLPETIFPPGLAGLPALDPCGVPLFGDRTPGGFNFSFFDTVPPSLPDPAPPSTSLPEPAQPAPGPFRARFFLPEDEA